mmetsp:Transcript_24604/g.43690  ORF Transcript_24604/g.43690 Transcript_24604/m.43690 type:complete len:768 (-) Transcript_24604:62-2365(-)
MAAKKGDTEKIFSCSLHPTHPLMAFGCETNVVKIYDIHMYAYVKILLMHGVVHAVRFSPCGTYLATASSSEEHDIYRVVIWEVKAPDGQNSTYRLEKKADDYMTYDTLQQNDTMEDKPDEKGKLDRRATFFLHQGRINTLEFLPRGEGKKCVLLASGSEDQTVRIWAFGQGDASEKSQATQVWRKHTGAVTCVRATIDGAFLASSADDGTVCIWKLRREGEAGLQVGSSSKEKESRSSKKWKKLKKLGLFRKKEESRTGEKLFTQVVEFRARSPVYALSFFPLVQTWKNGTNRYILACGSKTRIFLLKVHNAYLQRIEPVDFKKLVDTLTGDAPRWVLRSQVKDLVNDSKHNSLELELDFAEDLVKSSSHESETHVALRSIDTTVHEAKLIDSEGRETGENIQFLVCVGGGSGGKVYSWVFSVIPDSCRWFMGYNTEFFSYAQLKRKLLRMPRNMASEKERIKTEKRRKKEERELKKNKQAMSSRARRKTQNITNSEQVAREKQKKEILAKRIHRVRNDFTPIGEHMESSNVMSVALPLQMPAVFYHEEKFKNNNAQDTEATGPSLLLLNRLRDQYKMLDKEEYLAVSVSDDETARLFKFKMKDPHLVEVPERQAKQENNNFPGALAAVNAIKAIKDTIKGKKQVELKLKPPVMCVAVGTRSKTTKKMDGSLVLQRELTENQANLLYSLNEQARDMLKTKKQKEAAKKQEFKFKLDGDILQDKDRAKEEELRASKFTHFQNLAEPPPKDKAGRKANGRNEQCTCSIS